MQPVSTRSVALSQIVMELYFVSALQLLVDEPGLYMPAWPAFTASRGISSELATASGNDPAQHPLQPELFREVQSELAEQKEVLLGLAG